MLISFILAILLLTYLIIASVYDIKTREVPNWLPYSLIPLAFILKIIQSIISHSLSPLFYTVVTFAIFWAISLLFYHTKQWGGGDAKMFMTIGAALPTYPKYLLQHLTPNLNFPFPLILIINILIAGSFYGIIYFLFIAAKNQIKIKISRKIRIFTLITVMLLLILIIISPPETKLPLLLLMVLTAIFPYITKLSRVIQKKYFIKQIPLPKVTEGDWLAKDVYKNKKLLIKKTIPGLTLQHIQKLKKYKIKTVYIQYGIPFLPPLFLGTLLSLLIGNLFVF